MGTKICLTSFVGEGDDMKPWGAWESPSNSYQLKLSVFNLYPWLTQGYSSNCYVLNSYHLKEDIDVVGNKKNYHAWKIKAYNIEESQRMVTSMHLSASILNYHLLCVVTQNCVALQMSSNLYYHSLKNFLSYGRLHTHHFHTMAIYML
jgi:hypothetical protein